MMWFLGELSFSAWACLIALVLAGFLWTKKRKERRGKLPPGPFGLPFVGNLLQLGKRPQLKFQEWAQKFGKIYHMNFAGFSVIVLNETKLIKEAFNDPNLTGRPDLAVVYMLQGGQIGVVNSQGQDWVDQRRFTLRHLRDFGYGKNFMENLVLEEVNDFLGQLSQFAESGEAFAVNQSFQLAVINSLWFIISGKRYKHDDPDLRKIFDYWTEFQDELLKSPAVFKPSLAKLIPKWSGWAKVQRLLLNVRQLFIDAIQEHENEPPSDGQPRDFIDEYLKEIKATEDPKSSFYKETGRKNLTAVCADLFVAGYDTTSTTLSWALLYISKLPDVQKKMQEELDEVVGKSRQCCVADRVNLPYCEAVILEVLRKSSIFPAGLFHSALADVNNFHGYDIKKGTCILGNLYTIHHSPEYWTRPHEFNPKRFLSEDGKTIKRSENLIPFSTGRRVCAGEQMARDSIFLFLTNIFQKFSVQLAPESEGVTMDPKPGFILLAQDFKVTLKER